MSVHEILSLIACATAQISLRIFKVSPDGEGVSAPETGIFSFIEHDRFDFFTSVGRIRAFMYMSCVKCSCSELNLAKHLHTLFVLT